MSTEQPKKLNSYLLWLLRYEFQKFVPETTWWITCRITWWSLMINKMNQQQVLMIIDNLHLDSRWYQLPLLRYDKLSLDDHWYSWWSSLMLIDAHWWCSLMVIDDQQDESSASLDDHWQPAFGFMLISLAIVEKSQIHFCLIFNFFNFQISAAQPAPAAPFPPLRLYKSGRRYLA